MALRDYKPRSVTVPLNEESSVALRGLSFNDICVLIDRYRSEIEQAVTGFRGLDESDDGAIAGFLVSVLQDAPDLVASAIALAADESDAEDAVKKMSMTKQLELMQALGTVTFEEAGGVKKFIAMIAEIVGKISLTTKTVSPSAKRVKKNTGS